MTSVQINLPQDEIDKISKHFGNAINITSSEAEYLIIDANEIDQCSHDRKKLIVLSSEDNEKNIELIYKFKLRHLIGRNENYYLDEIKMVIDQDIPNEGTSFTINSSENLDKQITHEVLKLNFDGFFDSPKDQARFILNEFLTNALYKAPHLWWAAQNIPLPPRSEKVIIKDKEIEVSCTNRTEGIYLSVKDPFGSMEYDQIIQSIHRGMKEKTPEDKASGAGLGLYLSSQFSGQIIFHVLKGQSAKVISIIEKNKRYIKYQSRIRSFHFFEEE